MVRQRESGVSEMTASILIIALIVILASVTFALFSGVQILPKKPVLATFNANTVTGAGNVPLIALYQLTGDTLTQEYATGTHGGINGTKIKLIDPEGRQYTVVQSVTMTAKTMKKGDPYYIFHRNIGEPNEYWITMDQNRVFSASGGGLDPFSPHGRWQLLVTDEKDTNMVLFSKGIVI